jgi:hypothetical protein
METEIKPFIGLGEFDFGKKIDPYFDKYEFEYFKCDDATGWDTYKIVDLSIEIYTENGTIVSIACRKNCSLNGINIIGKNLVDFYNSLNINPNRPIDKIYVKEGEHYQDVIEIPEFGLQIWVYEEEIKTVFCSPLIEN